MKMKVLCTVFSRTCGALCAPGPTVEITPTAQWQPSPAGSTWYVLTGITHIPYSGHQPSPVPPQSTC